MDIEKYPFAHFVPPMPEFDHQLRSTFFGGKIDIREQRIEEIVAEPRLLPFVKAAARLDVIDVDASPATSACRGYCTASTALSRTNHSRAV